MNRCNVGSDGKTPLTDCVDEGTTHRFWNLERRSCACLPYQQEEECGTHDSILEYSLECCTRRKQWLSLRIKTRAANVRRLPGSERWNADRILGIRAVPWSPDGSDNAFAIQVGMERPAEMVPHSPGEVFTENKVARTYVRREDFDQWGLSEGCPGCWFLRSGQGRHQGHSEACRKNN